MLFAWRSGSEPLAAANCRPCGFALVLARPAASEPGEYWQVAARFANLVEFIGILFMVKSVNNINKIAENRIR